MANQSKAVEKPAVVEETQPAAKPVQGPSLDLKDLGLVLNLLNITIKRGTFEPHELRGVLDVYDKLEAFLKFQAQMQAAAATAAAQRGEA
jgi:hypothetical protein